MAIPPSLPPLNVNIPTPEEPLIPTAPATPEPDEVVDVERVIQGLIERARQHLLSSQVTKIGSEIDFFASQPTPQQPLPIEEETPSGR